MPSPSDLLISSTRIEEGHHDRVTVWNRGANAGTLTVKKGDGAEVAARLEGREPDLRSEAACAFLADQAAALSAKVAALEAGAEPAQDASTLAFDAIAKACGCPQWDYPGQVVRDVERLAKERDTALARVVELERHLVERGTQIRRLREALEEIANTDPSSDEARRIMRVAASALAKVTP